LLLLLPDIAIVTKPSLGVVQKLPEWINLFALTIALEPQAHQNICQYFVLLIVRIHFVANGAFILSSS